MYAHIVYPELCSGAEELRDVEVAHTRYDGIAQRVVVHGFLHLLFDRGTNSRQKSVRVACQDLVQQCDYSQATIVHFIGLIMIKIELQEK